MSEARHRAMQSVYSKFSAVIRPIDIRQCKMQCAVDVSPRIQSLNTTDFCKHAGTSYKAFWRAFCRLIGESTSIAIAMRQNANYAHSEVSQTERSNMANNALITVDHDNATLSAFESVDAVYSYINEALGKYTDLANMTFKWEKGKSLSKMVSEAQDGIGVEKKARAEQFRRIRAIFINEGINDLLEAVFRKFGAKAVFGSVSKTGVASFRFIPPTLANGKVDAVIKQANAMQTETRSKRMEQTAKALGFDILSDGTVVKRLE